MIESRRPRKGTAASFFGETMSELGPIVYVDTNVIDVYLRRNPENLARFLDLKRAGIRFACSLHLLTELSTNPKTEEAKASLRIVDRLCSKHLYFNTSDRILIDEILKIKSGMEFSAYCTRKQAQSVFESVWWAVSHEKFAEGMITPSKRVKKEFFADDKQLRRDLSLGNHTASTTFGETKALFNSESAYRGFIRRSADEAGLEIDDELAGRVIEARRLCPLIHCAITGEIARFQLQYVDHKTKPKFGDDFDVMHLHYAGYADYFLTSDPGFIEILETAASEWPFKFMTPADFHGTVEADLSTKVQR